MIRISHLQKFSKIALYYTILAILIILIKGLPLNSDITGGTRVMIKEQGVVKEVFFDISKTEKDIQNSLENTEILSIETFGSSVANNMFQYVVKSIIFGLLAIFIYVSIRFNTKFAISGILCLTHDVILTLFFISIFNIKFGITTCIAILTIIGYSINDTIVVFDKIREIFTKLELFNAIEKSINTVLRRSIMTSLSTIVSTFGIIIFCRGEIQDFAIIVFFGVTIGTISSIFISPYLIYILKPDSKSKSKKVLSHAEYAT